MNVGGRKATVRNIMGERGKQEKRWKVDEGKHLKIYEGLREGIEMGTYHHGPMDYHAKKLTLIISGGGPESARRRKRYTSCLVEEEVG